MLLTLTAKSPRTQRCYFFICPGKYPGQIKSSMERQIDYIFQRHTNEKVISIYPRTDESCDPIASHDWITA
jgi:hypothetical protein